MSLSCKLHVIQCHHETETVTLMYISPINANSPKLIDGSYFIPFGSVYGATAGDDEKRL